MFGTDPELSNKPESSSAVTISWTALKPTSIVTSGVYLEIIKDCVSAYTKKPFTKNDPSLIENLTPFPTAGFELVLVVWTVKVVPVLSPTISSEGLSRTGVAPVVPLKVLVYVTNKVAGSDPEAAADEITLILIPEFWPVKVSFISVPSVGRAFVVVSSLTNSTRSSKVAPPGTTDAPSLKIFLPKKIMFVG